MTKSAEPPIANRLRFYRKLHRLTLEQAGARVGCSHTQVADLERDRVQLTLGWMRKFAAAYHVSPADLLVEQDRGDEVSAAELHLIHQLRRASADKKATTLHLIDAALAVA